jgi:hypothetical protein
MSKILKILFILILYKGGVAIAGNEDQKETDDRKNVATEGHEEQKEADAREKAAIISAAIAAGPIEETAPYANVDTYSVICKLEELRREITTRPNY